MIKRTVQVTEYVVTYKTQPRSPQHKQVFANHPAAVQFCYQVEIEGGLSILNEVVVEKTIEVTNSLNWEDEG